MEVTYTSRSDNFEDGVSYRNPYYFDFVEGGVTSVILDGDYPEIKEAYEAAGIEVKSVEKETKTRRKKDDSGAQ